MPNLPGGFVWRGGEIKSSVLDKLHLAGRHSCGNVTLVIRQEYRSRKTEVLAECINFGVTSNNGT